MTSPPEYTEELLDPCWPVAESTSLRLTDLEFLSLLIILFFSFQSFPVKSFSPKITLLMSVSSKAVSISLACFDLVMAPRKSLERFLPRVTV